MRRLALLALGACWTATTAPPPSAPPSACVIRDDGDINADGVASLSVDGRVFASIVGTYRYLHARFTGTTATAELETSEVALEGDLAIAALRVRPRATALRDGWLDIRSATIVRATGDQLAVDVELPPRITPAKISLALPCRALTFEAANAPEEPAPATRVLRTGARLLSDARIEVGRVRAAERDETELEARVLETTPTSSRVSIDGDNPVVVWVDNRDLLPVPSETAGEMLGLSGQGTIARTLTCDRDIPIFVRNRSRFPVRVGRIKARAAFRLKPEQPGPELEIELGQRGAVPFIRRTDTVGCRSED